MRDEDDTDMHRIRVLRLARVIQATGWIEQRGTGTDQAAHGRSHKALILKTI
jgi:hypothetical protein